MPLADGVPQYRVVSTVDRHEGCCSKRRSIAFRDDLPWTDPLEF
jgi:hypothetical protein